MASPLSSVSAGPEGQDHMMDFMWGEDISFLSNPGLRHLLDGVLAPHGDSRVIHQWAELGSSPASSLLNRVLAKLLLPPPSLLLWGLKNQHPSFCSSPCWFLPLSLCSRCSLDLRASSLEGALLSLHPLISWRREVFRIFPISKLSDLGMG